MYPLATTNAAVTITTTAFVKSMSICIATAITNAKATVVTVMVVLASVIALVMAVAINTDGAVANTTVINIS